MLLPPRRFPALFAGHCLNRNGCPLGLGLLYKLLKRIIKARRALNFKMKCLIKILFPNLHYWSLVQPPVSVPKCFFLMQKYGWFQNIFNMLYFKTWCLQNHFTTPDVFRIMKIQNHMQKRFEKISAFALVVQNLCLCNLILMCTLIICARVNFTVAISSPFPFIAALQSFVGTQY